MRIAFVFPPYRHKKFEEDVAVVSREFGTFPPLGLGYAAAIAESSGHESLLVDAHAEKLGPAQILDRLKSFQPQMLGFMLTTYMFHDTLEYIVDLKRSTELPVVVGNVQMELYPHEVMTYRAIDYGITGPARDALPALLSAISAGKPVPEDLPGLCHRVQGEVRVNRPSTLREDFSRLPFPKRDGLPHDVYHAVMSKRRNVTALVTARGCLRECSFCHLHDTPYSARDPRAVADEMEQCVRKHRIQEFEIFDPSFTCDRARVLALCDEIVGRGLGIDFACRARVDEVDPQLLAKMAEAGCKRILYGVESGSQRQLDRIRKGITLAKIRTAIRQTRDAGIAPLGFFLVGVPDENRDTVEETIRFALGLDLDYAQFHRVVPKPRTELHDLASKALGYDYWREYTLGKKPEMRLPSPWTELGQEEIERLVFRAYRRFYLRPSLLGKALLGVRSFGELARYVRSGAGLLAARTDLEGSGSTPVPGDGA